MSTLASILVFAQEAAHGAAEHEESDKTLFYIFGGAAAVYALVLFAIGMTNHDFPRSKGTARGVFALSVAVVAAAMASAVITG
jgi:hypothetical protein